MTLLGEKTVEDAGTRAGSILRELGFGVHETAVILALNRLESASVADLSSETGIHHANLYAVLDSLVGKGLVILIDGRPKVYEFSSLAHVEEMFSTKLAQLLQDLMELQKSRETKSVLPALIYTIRGSADVLAKMHGMINRAENAIFLVAPDLDALGIMLFESLEAAQIRGVKLKGIFGKKPTKRGLKIQYHIKEDTLAINLVIDSIEALISMPDLSVCGWADNPLISMQFEGFLQQSWKLSRKE
ncbi:TrmB family transcriptional regulator [Candidatus Thorarchaeota archaeon]|nr:MAG: TrmB family transcriptional regulator [Candidatus Thorarchaeota archaeon]